MGQVWLVSHLMSASPALPTQGVVRTAEQAPPVLRLKNILVPIDLSDASEKALDYAVPFARRFGAKITLLYVTQAYFCASEFAYMPVEETEMRERIRRRLETLGTAAVGPELLGGTLVRDGSAFDEINRVAREIHADMIVINTHGYTGLKHIHMGITAVLVVSFAPCPVFVVRAMQQGSD